MLVHMGDLTFHCHEEENEEVDQQDWPEHRDIEDFKERHHQGD